MSSTQKALTGKIENLELLDSSPQSSRQGILSSFLPRHF